MEIDKSKLTNKELKIVNEVERLNLVPISLIKEWGEIKRKYQLYNLSKEQKLKYKIERQIRNLENKTIPYYKKTLKEKIKILKQLKKEL